MTAPGLPPRYRNCFISSILLCSVFSSLSARSRTCRSSGSQSRMVRRLLVTPMVEPWIIISAILAAEWSVTSFMALMASLESLAMVPTPSGRTPLAWSMLPAAFWMFRYSPSWRSRVWASLGSAAYFRTDWIPSRPISAVW